MFRDSEAPVHEPQFLIEAARDLYSCHMLKVRASSVAPERLVERTGRAGAEIGVNLSLRPPLTIDVVIYSYILSHAMLESYPLVVIAATSRSALGPGLPTSSGPISYLRPDNHAR